MAITVHAVAVIRSRRQKIHLSAFVMTEPRHEMLDYMSALALYMGGLAFRTLHHQYADVSILCFLGLLATSKGQSIRDNSPTASVC